MSIKHDLYGVTQRRIYIDCGHADSTCTSCVIYLLAHKPNSCISIPFVGLFSTCYPLSLLVPRSDKAACLCKYVSLSNNLQPDIIHQSPVVFWLRGNVFISCRCHYFFSYKIAAAVVLAGNLPILGFDQIANLLITKSLIDRCQSDFELL